MKNHFINMAFTAFIIAVNFVSPTLSAEESFASYAGEYLIRRYGADEGISGTVRIQQMSPESIALESFKLNEGHYQSMMKEDLRAKDKITDKPRSGSTFARLQKQLCSEETSPKLGLNSLYEKGEHNIAQYVLYQLQNSFLKMHLLSSQDPNNPQYGVVETYNKENLYVRFHVEKDLTGFIGDEFSIYIEYPYCYSFQGSGISTAAPAQKFNLIKVGSRRHEALENARKLFQD